MEQSHFHRSFEEWGTGGAASGGVPGNLRRGVRIGYVRPIFPEPSNRCVEAARSDVAPRPQRGEFLGVAKDPVRYRGVFRDTRGLLIGIGQPKKMFDGLHA